MDWLLSIDRSGGQVDEYGHSRIARSWSPKQTDHSVNDIVYVKRPLGIDWGYGLDRVENGVRKPKWQMHFKLGQLF